MLPLLELDLGGTLTIARARDELGQRPVAVWTDHEVHLRHAGQEFWSQTLCHAAHDPHHVTRPFVALQLTHATEDSLLGVIAHGARVDQQHVRDGRIVGPHVSITSQDAEHQLGIRDVHLTAVGLDVDAPHAS